jgi:uncharacterized protein (DUF488 family)
VTRIFTIGYEGTTVAEFVAALKKAGVERVIDVRALPLSRSPGFSKTPLKAALEEQAIEYLHLKALGRDPGDAAASADGAGASPGAAAATAGDGSVAGWRRRARLS